MKPEDQTTAVSVQPHSSTAVLSSIDQLMKSAASVDVDKLKALYDLHERFLEREAERSYNAAMAAVQAQLPIFAHTRDIVIPPRDNKPGRVQGSYTEFDALYEVVMPLLTEHGLSLTFVAGSTPQGVTATPVIRHVDGHKEVGEPLFMPTDTSGAKTGPQAVASALSYAKRYAMTAALNIATREEDDDGNGGAITPDQLAEMKALLESTRADVAAFLKYAHVDALESVRAAHFDKLMAAIRRKQHQPPVTVDSLTKPATVTTQTGTGPVVETTATVVVQPEQAPDVNAMLEQALAPESAPATVTAAPAPLTKPQQSVSGLFDPKKRKN